MTRRRWGIAFLFGLLNATLFLLAVRPLGLLLIVQAPLVGLLFLILCVVGAAWTLEAVDDLLRIGARDGAALVVRGTMAGALVGAIVAFAAFVSEDVFGAFVFAAFGGFFGLAAGAACSLVDLALLKAAALWGPEWAQPDSNR